MSGKRTLQLLLQRYGQLATAATHCVACLAGALNKRSPITPAAQRPKGTQQLLPPPRCALLAICAVPVPSDVLQRQRRMLEQLFNVSACILRSMRARCLPA